MSEYPLSDIRERLTETENDVSGLKESVARLGTKVDSVDDNIHIVINSLNAIREKVSSSEKTNWSTIATVGVLIIAIVGGAFTYVISEINSDIRRVDNNQEAQFLLHLKLKDEVHSNEVDQLKREIQNKNK